MTSLALKASRPLLVVPFNTTPSSHPIQAHFLGSTKYCCVGPSPSHTTSARLGEVGGSSGTSEMTGVGRTGEMTGVGRTGEMTGGRRTGVMTGGRRSGVMTGGRTGEMTGGRRTVVITGGRRTGVMTGGRRTGVMTLLRFRFRSLTFWDSLFRYRLHSVYALQGHFLVTTHLCDSSLSLQVTLIEDDIFPDQHSPIRLVYQSVPTRTPTVPHHDHLRSFAVQLSSMLCWYMCIRSTPKYIWETSGLFPVHISCGEVFPPSVEFGNRLCRYEAVPIASAQ